MTGPFALRGEVEIIAHRGFSAEAPENTIAALQAGLDAGADAVEFDLHTASDGTPVLLHDEKLNRTTDGRGKVHRRTAEELAALDAGSWFGPAFAGEPLPTLADALAAVAERAGRIYAELKGARDVDDLDGVARIFMDAALTEKTVYISMDWTALDRIRRTCPDALVGYIVDKERRAKGAIDRAAADPRALLDFDARILLDAPAWAERALVKGIPLATWTVDDVDAAAELLRMGVPRITTNRLRELAAWRDGLARARLTRR